MVKVSHPAGTIVTLETTVREIHHVLRYVGSIQRRMTVSAKGLARQVVCVGVTVCTGEFSSIPVGLVVDKGKTKLLVRKSVQRSWSYVRILTLMLRMAVSASIRLLQLPV